MKRTVLTALALSLIVPVASASAQACLGLPGLVTRSSNLLINADFTDGAKSLGGRLGFGTSIAFGGVGASVRDYDNVDGTGFGIGVDGGLSLVGGSTQNVLFCPIAGLSYEKLPSDLDFSTTQGRIGLAAGASLKATPGLDLIPFGSLSAVFDRYSFDDDATNSGSDNDTYGLLSLGLGFQFAQGLIFRPAISAALGRDGSDPVYSIGLALPLGRR